MLNRLLMNRVAAKSEFVFQKKGSGAEHEIERCKKCLYKNTAGNGRVSCSWYWLWHPFAGRRLWGIMGICHEPAHLCRLDAVYRCKYDLRRRIRHYDDYYNHHGKCPSSYLQHIYDQQGQRFRPL